MADKYSNISRIWPKYEPDCIRSEAERKVYRAFYNALPENLVIWHSLRLRSPITGEHCEADFVIADSSKPGIIIIEVKGGLISKQNGAWYQYDRPLDASPLDQAHRCRRILLDCFRHKGVHPPYITVAACFPDCEFDMQPTQGDLDGIVLGHHDMPYLADNIPLLFDRAIPTPWTVDSQWIQTIHKLWGETWVPSINLGRKIKFEQDQRIKLDQEQSARLHEICSNRRMLITGGAGTGKTILAREAAVRLAERGKCVLLLCYTDALANGLANEIEHSSIQVAPIRRFAVDLFRNAKQGTIREDDSSFWNSISLRAADTILDADKWDAVVIDEGQDLSENDWILVEECLASGGYLWVFADEYQGFWFERKIPSEIIDRAFKINLSLPYRCPEPIQHLADCYAGRRQLDPKLVSEGLRSSQIKIITSSEAKLIKQVGKEVNRLVSDGLKPQDIAVISLRGVGASESIIYQDRLGIHKAVRATDPDAATNLVCDTFLRFKGLERPAVIVTDLRLVDKDYNVRMHIAISRASNILRIVGHQAAIQNDSMLIQYTGNNY